MERSVQIIEDTLIAMGLDLDQQTHQQLGFELGMIGSCGK